MTKLPNSHFNATELLKEVLKHLPLPRPAAKVSQFFDNVDILDYPSLPTITLEGRGGYTAIPNELRKEYDKWLANVGIGKGGKNVKYLDHTQPSIVQ